MSRNELTLQRIVSPSVAAEIGRAELATTVKGGNAPVVNSLRLDSVSPYQSRSVALKLQDAGDEFVLRLDHASLRCRGAGGVSPYLPDEDKPLSTMRRVNPHGPHGRGYSDSALLSRQSNGRVGACAQLNPFGACHDRASKDP